MTMEPIGVAVLGAGYWGPNLVRNAVSSASVELRWVCDLDLSRAQRLSATYAGVRATADLSAVLSDSSVEVVAIATPASTHAPLAIRVLEAGKHVVIEKPLASSLEEASAILAVAEANNRIVMCDHTYCYTPAVQYIRESIAGGVLGDVQFIDSVRINLGLVQKDIDVVWDLAPHDLSIIDAILPETDRVCTVSATGADPVGVGQNCVAYLSMGLASGAIAHVHVNWLSPTKVRRMIVGGSRRTLVWDDLDPIQRISMFDRGVDLAPSDDPESDAQRRVAYRVGDMVAPALREREALAAMFDELVDAVRENRAPLTDGRAGLRVLQLLEAARRSMASQGRAVEVTVEGVLV